MRSEALLGSLLGVLVLVVACGGEDEPIGSGGDGTGGSGGGGAGAPPAGGGAGGDADGAAGDGAVEGACGPIDATLAKADAADLFAWPEVPTFDLFLPADAWENLKLNARDEEYVEAEACFEGRSIGRVGMRFKGSYGSLYNCFDEAGVNTCRKLGMKLKFDEYVNGQLFHGLERLNLHGYRYDGSYLHERIAYDLYRAMDVYAPRAAWANVRVNGELEGLFGMVEEIDGHFTADRWPDNGGNNLYKEAWPTFSDPVWLAEHLKTNEATPDVAAFAAFADAMAGAEPAALRETLGAYTELDYLARYMAVDDAIANYDGITTYYSSDDATWAGNHNFYFYEEASNRFTLIPWDLESTMLPNTGFGDVPHWTRLPEDCAARYPVWNGENIVVAPGCDPVFRALAADLTGYRAAGQELLDGPFAESALGATIDEHAAFIREAVSADPHGPGAAKFENEVAFLKTQVPLLRTRFERLLAGESWTPLQFDIDTVNGFETIDDFGLLMGPLLMSNPNTTVSVSVKSTDPMVGAQSLLMEFEYANEAVPWEQWSFYRVPMRAGSVDLTTYTGIRMWVRADQQRSLRFDLDSPNESAASQGIRNGWDITVTDVATQVEVLLADQAVPGWAKDQGRDPGDDPALIIATVSGLVFYPQCLGRGTVGQLPEGTTDPGFLEVDAIEFF